ncbi:LXG domain-containing protein [Metabacillus sp. GX 13764]|uniref:LXG domain-containing protein n=1 Tax=Metabacillus kandeliae TaxID=2900151 RepID=UPI001E349183|nr:LXG domain-containing protein [Metabacillus kandeliae]MCD7034178.1 LXG domain-containing protein [Metabacillus kandeliae]
MKILDADSLNQGIQNTLKEIKSQKEQLSKLSKSISSLEGLSTSLTGKGGQAIRSYYGDVHQPILSYYDYLFDDLSQFLDDMKARLSDLESDKSAHIHQGFLESELKNGLDKTKNYTADLTDEANGIIDSLSGIAWLSPLDDGEVLDKVEEGKKHIKETIEQLSDFDSQTSSSLSSSEQNIHKLKSSINEISGMYKSGKLSVGSYSPSQLSEAKKYDDLKGDLFKKRITSLGETLTSPFSTLNENLSWADNALILSQLGSLGTASYFSKHLKIRYKGGVKPSLLDRLRGRYKFTVSTDPSWTSKGKYSNKWAKMIRNFLKAPEPSNPFLKLAYKYGSTYQSPAHLLKHVMGYPKNFNGWLDGKSFKTGLKARIETGSKDILKTAMDAKGFRNAAKLVPGAATAISIIGNTEELFSPENANKTYAERAGRTFAGIATDMAAISAGAEIGAIAGTAIGGPVGTIVGGAVGGLAGGIASSVVGDKVKDIGEKVFGEGEKLVKKGYKELSKGVENTFHSIKGWFN